MDFNQHQECDKTVVREGIRTLSLNDMKSVGGGEGEDSGYYTIDTWYTGLFGDMASGGGLGGIAGGAYGISQYLSGATSLEVGSALGVGGVAGGVIGATAVLAGAAIGGIIQYADPTAPNLGGGYNAMGDFTGDGGGGGNPFTQFQHSEF